MYKLLSDVKYNEGLINEVLSGVNKRLYNYIKENIKGEYSKNDGGHNWFHINSVIKRSVEISVNYNVNIDILYTVAAFHDIGCHIDRKTHELISSDIAYKDKMLNNIFSKEDMLIIKEAIEDHRASLEYVPRNIYGKILSSADRKVSIKEYLIASISYRINKGCSKEEVLENVYLYAINKFGVNGYAVNKFYVENKLYRKFLLDLQNLLKDKFKFLEISSFIYDELITNKGGI